MLSERAIADQETRKEEDHFSSLKDKFYEKDFLTRNLKNSNCILKTKLNKNKVARYSATDRDSPKTNMTGKKKDKSQEFFFKIIYTNATSLNNKIMELELYLRCNDWPHVVFFFFLLLAPCGA